MLSIRLKLKLQIMRMMAMTKSLIQQNKQTWKTLTQSTRLRFRRMEMNSIA